MRSSVITTFPSLTKPSPASANATAVTPVASSSVTSAIAAVAAARAAQAQAQAAQAATIAATVTQPPITTSVSPAASIVTTVNGRKRRNSNSSSNGLSPTYARMENSSNLSQSMDSVNTASGEEEVSNSVSFFRSLCRLLTLVVVVEVVTRTRIIKLNEAVFSTKDDRTSLMLLLSKPPFFSSHLLPAKCFESSNGINADEMTT